MPAICSLNRDIGTEIETTSCCELVVFSCDNLFEICAMK